VAGLIASKYCKVIRDKAMKQFTPKDLHHSPLKVYREAERDGAVEIKHGHYPDGHFVLTYKSKWEDDENVNDSDSSN